MDSEMCNKLICKLFNMKGTKYLFLIDILNDISSVNNLNSKIILGSVIDVLVDDKIIDEEYNWNFIVLDTSEIEIQRLYKQLSYNYHKSMSAKETHRNYELLMSYSELIRILLKDSITNIKILAKKISAFNEKYECLF